MVSSQRRIGAGRSFAGPARCRTGASALAVATVVLSLAACDGDEGPVGLVARTAASVEILEEGVQLRVGETRTLRVEIRDADDRPLPEAPLSWSSADVGVAVVHASGGVVTATGPGGTHVYAESGLVRDSVSVSVFEQANVAPTPGRR